MASELKSLVLFLCILQKKNLFILLLSILLEPSMAKNLLISGWNIITIPIAPIFIN